MKSLTRSTRDDYWNSASEAARALLNLLRLSIAKEDDDDEEEDPDNYWHP